jgi:hypothetical protein
VYGRTRHGTHELDLVDAEWTRCPPVCWTALGLLRPALRGVLWRPKPDLRRAFNDCLV